MNDFWQENKRLLTLAGCGLLVYLIGWLVIDNLYGSKVASETRNVSSYRTKLNSERYSVENRNEARSENEALRASLAALRERAEFVPRPEFVLPPAARAWPAATTSRWSSRCASASLRPRGGSGSCCPRGSTWTCCRRTRSTSSGGTSRPSTSWTAR